MPDDSLLKWRDEFPILSRCNYLISNSLGAMPRGVYDSLRDYADTWAGQGVSAWGAGWFELPQTVGNKIAPLMGAAENTVLVHQNASIANSILFGALDFSDPRRDKVVITALGFPQRCLCLAQLAARSHAYSDDPLARWHPALTCGRIAGRHRRINPPGKRFPCAFPQRLSSCQRGRSQKRRISVGAQVLFNGYHSVGVIPVDVGAWEVDYYIGGVLKWLCGGPGGVFMYVRPDLLPSLKPKVTGWFASASPFAFDVEKSRLARRRLPPDERHARHRFPARHPAWRRHHRPSRRRRYPPEVDAANGADYRTGR